jgi:type VI secretion system VasD/TssJ family lipoprotein
MKYFKFLILILISIIFYGCSSHVQPTDGANQRFAKNAIAIDYNAAKNLNMQDGQSHTIALIVYQLNNINSFNNLAKSKDGVLKLLSAKKFDSSVMSVNKIFVAPKQANRVFLNRAEKTVWVAIVAGYYNFLPSQVTQKYKILPYNQYKFWKSKFDQKFLHIKIYLEKSSIQKGNNNE